VTRGLRSNGEIGEDHDVSGLVRLVLEAASGGSQLCSCLVGVAREGREC
jgi:hypothetical protein